MSLTEQRPRGGGLRLGGDARLTASVVAAVARLHEERAELARCDDEVVVRRDFPIRTDGELVRGQPSFLRGAILDDRQHRTPRPDWRVTLRGREGADADLLDLEGDDVAVLREIRGGKRVVELRGDDAISDRARGAVSVWIEHVNIVAERARSHRGHSAQLSTAQDADRRARRDIGHQRASSMFVSSNTSSVRCFRQTRSRSRNSARCVDTIDVASSAALIAPGSPMASVPTGTPFGICTIDNNESRPFNMVAGMGTPSTGSVVLEAIMPGRCAAPPAAATMTSMPRDSALDA